MATNDFLGVVFTRSGNCRLKTSSLLPRPPHDPDHASFYEMDPPTFAWTSSPLHTFNRTGIDIIVKLILDVSERDENQWGYTEAVHYDPLYHCVKTYVMKTLADRYKEQISDRTEIEKAEERLADSSDTRRHRVSTLSRLDAPFQLLILFRLAASSTSLYLRRHAGLRTSQGCRAGSRCSSNEL